MVKAMNCGSVLSEFVLQSRYYVHFRANALKVLTSLSSQLWVKQYHYCSSRRMALALNSLKRVDMPLKINKIKINCRHQHINQKVFFLLQALTTISCLLFVISVSFHFSYQFWSVFIPSFRFRCSTRFTYFLMNTISFFLSYFSLHLELGLDNQTLSDQLIQFFVHTHRILSFINFLIMFT